MATESTPPNPINLYGFLKAASEVVVAELSKDHRVARAAQAPENPRQLVVDLAPGEHGHHFLLQRLVAIDARVRSFAPEAMKLEDAFLKLTTGALQ